MAAVELENARKFRETNVPKSIDILSSIGKNNKRK